MYVRLTYINMTKVTQVITILTGLQVLQVLCSPELEKQGVQGRVE